MDEILAPNSQVLARTVADQLRQELMALEKRETWLVPRARMRLTQVYSQVHILNRQCHAAQDYRRLRVLSTRDGALVVRTE